MTVRRRTGLLLVLLATMAAVAALVVVGVRPEPTPTRAEQAYRIAAGLRCPVCQDLSAADSPAPLARQMRHRITADLAAGRSPARIRARFVSAYGPSVLMSPSGSGVGAVVRALPFVVPGVGLVVGGVLLRRWLSGRRRRPVAAPPPASPPARAPVRAPRRVESRARTAPRAPWWRRRVVVLGTALVASVGVSTALVGALEARPAPPAVGTARTAAVSSDGQAALDAAVRRVRRHPRDVAAHLALARSYASLGQQRLAAIEYLAVARVDPGNAEANTALAMMAFVARAPAEAKRIVDRVLHAHPDYPEALYTRGLVQLMGLHHRSAGRADLHAYLRAAPFGAHQRTVETLLALSEKGSTR
jgi:cytochrome c-type biogenesis protein CcmH/NrfF